MMQCTRLCAKKRYQIIVANLQRHCVHLAFVSYFHFFPPRICLYSIHSIYNKKKKEKIHFFLQQTIESLYKYIYIYSVIDERTL